MQRSDLSRRGHCRWLIVAALAVLLMTACSSSDDSTPTDPDDGGDVEIVTETFAGSLILDGTSCHDFEVTQTGDITMILTAIGPLETLTLGIGIGVPPAEGVEEECTFIAQDQSVRRLEALLTSNRSPGPHCVCVFDVGNIFPDITVTYSLDVSHP